MHLKYKILILVWLAVFVVAGIHYFTKTRSLTLSQHVYSQTVCQDATSTSTRTCFSDYYVELVKKYGAPAAIEDIKKRAEENSFVSGDCHPLMHIIGETASENYQTVSDAFRYGDSYCWSGYYHGAMEGFVARIGEDKIGAEINSICADVPGKNTYSFDYYNCVHGLGHGIMELKGDELFDSLKTCDSLSGRWEQESCYSGIFMENIVSNERLGSSKYLKPDQPLYPCTAVADPYKRSCYLGQTSYALEVSNYNFYRVFKLCTEVEQPNRDICFQSLGRDSANQARHDSAETKSTCEIASDANDKKNCIDGAVKEFISFYHSDKEAKEFCSLLDQTDKETCLTTAVKYYTLF
jgi:hypothetical protein